MGTRRETRLTLPRVLVWPSFNATIAAMQAGIAAAAAVMPAGIAAAAVLRAMEKRKPTRNVASLVARVNLYSGALQFNIKGVRSSKRGIRRHRNTSCSTPTESS